MNTLSKIRTIRSHVGLSRFFAECDGGMDGADIIGSVPVNPMIPSPYAWSPTKSVYCYRGRPVVIYETAHKVYEIFAVAGPVGPIEV